MIIRQDYKNPKLALKDAKQFLTDGTPYEYGVVVKMSDGAFQIRMTNMPELYDAVKQVRSK